MSQFSSLLAILSSVFVLIAGNGLMNTLVPYRAKLEHFPDFAIGLIGSSYFIGMLAGTVLAPRLIRRAGFIRAFAALTTASVIASLLYPMAVNPYVWLVLRAVIGFCFAGLYAVIETWVNSSATPATRGRTYAYYQMVSFVGSAGGQQIFAALDARSFELFSAGAILFALAILPLSFTKSDIPSQPKSLKFQVWWLTKQSPVGAATALCTGLTNGAFGALSAVYGIGIGLSAQEIGLFLTLVVAGSAMAVWPIGRLSDHVERRKVLVIMVIGAMMLELFMAQYRGSGGLVLQICGFFLGMFMFTQYTLAVAHSNDRVGSDYALQVSSGLLFIYCIGAIVGPALGASLMTAFGPHMLFLQAGLAHCALAVFILYRIFERTPAVPAPRKDIEPTPVG